MHGGPPCPDPGPRSPAARRRGPCGRGGSDAGSTPGGRRAQARAPEPGTVRDRRLLRRRGREHVPDPPVVRAARRAGEDASRSRSSRARPGAMLDAARRVARAASSTCGRSSTSSAFVDEQALEHRAVRQPERQNFQMMRYGRMWHVFVNHGESDKMYMTTNQFKAYDYAFVAGTPPRARLEAVLWDYDLDKRAIADRPPAGRPLSRRAAVRARRPHGRALRPDLGGRPAGGRLRVDRLARRRARATRCSRRPRTGWSTARTRAAACVDRDYRRAHREIVAADRRRQRRATRRRTTSTTTGAELGWQLAGGRRRRSPTSRRWSTTASPRASRSWSPGRCRPRPTSTSGATSARPSG